MEGSVYIKQSVSLHGSEKVSLSPSAHFFSALEALTGAILLLHGDSRIKRQMSFIKHLRNELFSRQYVFRHYQYFIKP